MVRKGIWGIIGIGIIILILGVATSQVIKESKPERKISAAAVEAAENNGTARVYIKFKENNSRRVLGAAAVGDEKIRHKFGNVISADLGAKDLKALENNPDVEEIGLIKMRYIALTDSVPMMNATQAYPLQVNGLNLTGRGESVCVIDTGVDYNHSSLGGCLGAGCKVSGGHDFVNNDANPDDDHGHGTHVAGIVAANGTVWGMAPEANILALKACNSGGSCGDDDIKASILWCVGNASVYNISVISISIGGGLYDYYCTGEDDPLDVQESISAAFVENISVVVATGNGLNNDGDGNATNIAFPACLHNVTAVSSVTKSDEISSFSNRNNMSRLMAVGSSITSTKMNGGTELRSGTSMATPHVSGAIALMNQYFRALGISRTPRQIEDYLNGSGKMIEDSATGRNYSRIRVYDAMIALDASAPNVTLSSPANNTYTQTVNQTFRCNASDWSLRNATFYLWNSSALWNASSGNANGENYAFEINITGMPSDAYKWNCKYTDSAGNYGYASSNRTVTLSSIAPELISPADSLATNLNQTFRCNATSSVGLSNVSFYLWNSTGIENVSFRSISGAWNSTNFTYNFTRGGNYTWNCVFVDAGGQSKWGGSNYSIGYDIFAPVIAVVSPLNGSWINGGRFNVTLNERGNCSYSLDGGINNVSLNSSDAGVFSAWNLTLEQDAWYNVSYFCNDSLGNINSTSGEFRIDLTEPVVSPLGPDDGYSSASEVTFDYNASDNLNITGCQIVFDGVVAASNGSWVTNSTNSISYLPVVGTYSWKIQCSDEAGNRGNSSLRTVTITNPTTSLGGGGGGGGGAASGVTYSLSEAQIEGGYTKEIKKEDKIQFKTTRGGVHTLSVNVIGANFVQVAIRSEPINLTLYAGESKKLNLSSAGYYDLYVKLEGITNTKANLTLREIYEPMPTAGDGVSVENNTLSSENESSSPTTSPVRAGGINPYIIAGAGLIILIIIIFGMIQLRRAFTRWTAEKNKK